MLTNAELEEHPDNIEGLEGLDPSWEINFSDLEFGKELARGNFGAVSKADYLGTRVAVKRLFDLDDDMKIYLQRELNVLKQIRHPNIVQFLGLSKTAEGALYLITEFVERGDLCRLLYDPTETELDSWALRLRISVASAQGLAYLHAKKLMHRDLKAANYLVGENWHIKLCDFGFSRSTAAARKGGGPIDAGNVMTLCVPEEHEILTNRGFMDLDAYRARAKHDAALLVAGYDRARRQLVFERPIQLVDFARSTQPMVELDDAATGVSLLVTREHKLFADWQRSAALGVEHANFRKVPAGALLDAPPGAFGAVRQLAGAENGVAHSCGAAPPPAAEAKQFCALYGYWRAQQQVLSSSSDEASDGAVVQFRAPANAQREWLCATLRALGCAPELRHADGEDALVCVSDASWLEAWTSAEPGDAAPRWVCALSAQLLRAVLDGAQRASGESAPTGELRVRCAAARDELLHAALLAGYTARFERCTDAAGEWRIAYGDAKTDSVAFAPLLDRAAVRERAYTGRTWCFTMPSGFVWTRRSVKDASGAVCDAHRALLTGNCGTDEWMAPETIMGLDYDASADVFSFAMYLTEVILRAEPEQRSPGNGYRFDMAKFKRLAPDSCPPEFIQIVEAGTTYDAAKRPTMKQMLQALQQLTKSYKDPEPEEPAAPAATEAKVEKDGKAGDEKTRRRKKHHKSSKDDKKKKEKKDESKEKKKERKTREKKSSPRESSPRD